MAIFRYRIEYKDIETDVYDATYIAASTVNQAIDNFRSYFNKNYKIVEVSRCIDSDWSNV